MSRPVRCSKCGRALRDPYSIAVGMGPECRGGFRKAGGKLPRPKFVMRGGKVVYDGLLSPQDPLVIAVEDVEREEDAND